jgi:hypothetical protein
MQPPHAHARSAERDQGALITSAMSSRRVLDGSDREDSVSVSRTREQGTRGARQAAEQAHRGDRVGGGDFAKGPTIALQDVRR